MQDSPTDKEHWVPIDQRGAERLDAREPVIAIAVAALMVSVGSASRSLWVKWGSRLGVILAFLSALGMLWVHMGKTSPDLKYSVRRRFNSWQHPLQTLAYSRRVFWASLVTAALTLLGWLVMP